MLANRLLVVGIACLLTSPATRADEPNWATTTKYLRAYLAEGGHTTFSKDGDISLWYTPGDPFSIDPPPPPLGSFQFIIYDKRELKKDFATYATLFDIFEVDVELKKLDPALSKITEEKIGETMYHRLLIAGPKESAAITFTRLRESRVLKGTPDFQAREKPTKHDSVELLFKSSDTAKAASKAFRRAAILSGAKESERDPFKD